MQLKSIQISLPIPHHLFSHSNMLIFQNMKKFHNVGCKTLVTNSIAISSITSTPIFPSAQPRILATFQTSCPIVAERRWCITIPHAGGNQDTRSRREETNLNRRLLKNRWQNSLKTCQNFHTASYKNENFYHIFSRRLLSCKTLCKKKISNAGSIYRGGIRHPTSLTHNTSLFKLAINIRCR